MNTFRKLKLQRMFKDGFTIEELSIAFPEHSRKEIVKAVKFIKRNERV